MTSAAGMKKVVEAIVNNTNEVISCSAILYGEYGLYNLSMGVPAMLGRGGIHNILEMKLAPDERYYLTVTLDVLKATMQQVDNYLGVSFQPSEN
jgi:malate/lactate dehydrogenase